jgi:peptide/nickel transport system substrate-binding protein
VREAFELALDRQGLAQVGDGRRSADRQPVGCPEQCLLRQKRAIPKRDVDKARALLKAAGIPNPSFTLVTPTTSDAQRIALVIQAMTPGCRL